MSQDLETLIIKVQSLGEVSADEANRVVNDVFVDGIITRNEAENLFRLNDVMSEADPVWDARFVECIKDYVLTDEEPIGWVSDEESDWLMDNIRRDGQVKTATELDLLLSLLRHAEGVPERLSRFTLRAVCDRIKDAGRALPEDVERMRRALYAPAGDGANWVSSYEATQMFLTNDAIAFARNDDSWNDLFARAIANHLLASAHPDPVSEADALERELWLKDTDVSAGSFFSRMSSSFSDGGWFSKVTHSEEKASAARQAAADAAHREAEKVTEDESAWFMKRLGWDKTISPAERALIEFLKAEAPGFADGIAAVA